MNEGIRVGLDRSMHQWSILHPTPFQLHCAYLANRLSSHFFLLVGWEKVPCTAATSGLLYQPQMIGEDDCGTIGGMKIGRRNRSTRRKPAPAPLCPPQIPLDQTRDRNRPAALGSQRLTASAMARLCLAISFMSLTLPGTSVKSWQYLLHDKFWRS
jgi:hypothetical protein